MRRYSRNSAYVLLLAFVVGSLIAPSSHYVFMLFSDLYGINHVNEQQDDSRHIHNGHVNHSNVDDKPNLSDKDKQHFECEYAALFATFAAPDLPSVPCLDKPLLKQVLSASNEQIPPAYHFVPFYQRGPPAVSHI